MRRTDNEIYFNFKFKLNLGLGFIKYNKLLRLMESPGKEKLSEQTCYEFCVLSLSFLRHKDGVATQQFLIIYGSGCLGAGDRTGAGTHETAGRMVIKYFFSYSCPRIIAIKYSS